MKSSNRNEDIQTRISKKSNSCRKSISSKQFHCKFAVSPGGPTKRFGESSFLAAIVSLWIDKAQADSLTETELVLSSRGFGR